MKRLLLVAVVLLGWSPLVAAQGEWLAYSLQELDRVKPQIRATRAQSAVYQLNARIQADLQFLRRLGQGESIVRMVPTVDAYQGGQFLGVTISHPYGDFKKGDLVIAVNGQPLTPGLWRPLIKQSAGQTIVCDVRRKNMTLTVSSFVIAVTPDMLESQISSDLAIQRLLIDELERLNQQIVAQEASRALAARQSEYDQLLREVRQLNDCLGDLATGLRPILCR